MEPSYQNLKNYLKQVPSQVINLVTSDDLGVELHQVASEYQFDANKTQRFINETVMVLIGLEPASSYILNLRTELSITAERAEQIAQYVGQNIFPRVAGYLENLHKKAETEQSQITSTPSSNSLPRKTPEESASLITHVAAFQERKKRMEEETMRRAPQPPTNLPGTSSPTPISQTGTTNS